MRRILCVAEKNDVAKSVAGILANGHFNRIEGRSKFNKIYRFELDVRGERSIISMTSVSGHLMNYQFGPETKNWEGIPMASLFEAPIHHLIIPNMDKIEATLKEQARNSDTLIIWTDCDREGENIGAEIIKTCQQVKRNIDVFRAKFSEITPQAIHTAMRTLVRIDQRIVDAVDCRSELDLRIGAAFTRLQTLHLRNQFAHLMGNNNGGSSIASYGSCQFPTLGFIVERYKAIQEFIQETFWKLVIEHQRNGMKVEFAWDRVRNFDRGVVEVLYDDCKEARCAKVTKVATKPKSKWRPQPLDTVELEKLAVRKLKISAKVTMAIAEKLYNKGYISYPRTETNKFAPDIDLDRLVQMQTASNEWGTFATQVVQRGPNPRNGNKSDEAHPPIHPLKFADRADLQGQDWSIYELIVRHFLACVSWDAAGKETRVDLVCGGEAFHATGLQVSDLGYMNVYKYDKWSDKTIPLYVEGEALADHNLKICDGQTQPPQLLNEADLISLMDKFGIGTDATHADHIDKIKERQYVSVQHDGRFIPGILGLGLVDGYDDMGFAMSKPHLRADLERQLQAICAGTRTKNEVLEEQKAKYRRIFEQSELQVMKLSAAMRRNLNNNQNRHLIAVAQQQQPPPAAPQRGRGGGARGGDRGRGGGGRGGRGGGRGGSGEDTPNPNRIDSDDLMPFGATAGRGRGRGRGATAATRGTRGGRGGGAAPQAADGPQCQCGEPAAQRTVNKEGQNKGKRFWTCGKMMTDPAKCNFFEWA